MKVKITVFTPTYNRAYIIENLYHSLQRQTYKGFEWLVIDDGSTDNTKELFEQIVKEKNDFSIRYYRKENGGKCSAINYALELAEGELFFTVDSDDFLTDNALEKIKKWEAELPKSQKYCGFAGNLGTAHDSTPNTMFENDYFDGTALDRYDKVDGERAMVFYTQIHRQYLYPIFPGEKFMTEAVAWNRMANDGYTMRFYNDIIWIYEYKEDGLTKAGNRLFIENPRGYGLWLKEKYIYERKSFLEIFKMRYAFVCELKDIYSTRLIAECIESSVWGVKCLKTINKVLCIIRKC